MNDIASTILAGFGLTLLWLAIYYGWKPYRIDRVRNELFAIRDDLFLYAANGGVSFDDPAYRTLRDRLNALIRYAHIITLSRSVFFTIAERYVHNYYASALQQKWVASISRLPEPVQAKMKEVNDRVTIVLVSQVVTGSPLLLAVLAIYVPIMVVVSRLRRDPYEKTGLRVAKELRVELIEEQAVFAQSQEREMAACAG